MRILVADDDPVLQAIAAAILEPEGHEILQALDGLEALKVFETKRPDLVLTDYSMPSLDGVELCRRIQELADGRFVPVVMLTGAARANLLKESLEAGAMEFLTKPFEPDELRVRVQAIARMAELHNNIVARKAEDDEELAVVKHVLARLVEPSLRAIPAGLHMETLQTGRISGDACVYSLGIPGVHFGLLCDATGHGLMAGVSTIPVVETFQGMVTKDIPLERIFKEINAKLCRMLPTGRFACLLLFRLDVSQRTISVLNAGMPTALLRRQDGSLRAFPSRALPAGVLRAKEDLFPEQVSVSPGDRFLACSDGLTDAFCHQETEQHLLLEGLHLPHEAHCQWIRDQVALRVRNRDLHDDISWALWQVPEAFLEGPRWPLPQRGVQDFRSDFRIRLTLDPKRYEFKDVLPQVVSLLLSQRVDQSSAQLVSLLLGEALVNAVDHGILRLSSNLKNHGDFEAYEAERQLRMQALDSGSVELSLEVMEEPGSGRPSMLKAQVRDSGPGFDWKARLQPQAEFNALPHGRGLALIQALGQDLTFNDAGNEVTFFIRCE